MSYSLEELCVFVNVKYDRELEAGAVVYSSEEVLWKTRIKLAIAKDANY